LEDDDLFADDAPDSTQNVARDSGVTAKTSYDYALIATDLSGNSVIYESIIIVQTGSFGDGSISYNLALRNDDTYSNGNLRLNAQNYVSVDNPNVTMKDMVRSIQITYNSSVVTNIRGANLPAGTTLTGFAPSHWNNSATGGLKTITLNFTQEAVGKSSPLLTATQVRARQIEDYLNSLAFTMNLRKGDSASMDDYLQIRVSDKTASAGNFPTLVDQQPVENCVGIKVERDYDLTKGCG
jgi:chitodextrinase